MKELNDIIESQKADIEKLKSDLGCEKCDFKAKSVSSLIMHLMKKHNTRNYKNIQCKDCDFTCQKEFDLKLHISVKHPEKSAEVDFTKMKFVKTNFLTKMTYSSEY